MGERFERFVGIDWSGAASPSGQRIYVAEASRRGSRVRVASVVRARDRAAVEAFLRGGPLEPSRSWRGRPTAASGGARTGGGGARTGGGGAGTGAGRRVVALDFAFGFPVSFEHPGRGREWSWDDLGSLADRLDGESPRAALAADPVVRRQFRLRGGDGVPAAAHRATDRRLNGLRPESVFHLIGPSQVGLGSIAGIAMLHRLRGAVGVGIWPFDARERVDSARTVLVEAWPRMWLERGCRKNEPAGRARQLARWAEQRVSFAPGAREAALSSADALDAAAAAIGAAKTCHRLPSPELLPPEALEREGWILGAKVG